MRPTNLPTIEETFGNQYAELPYAIRHTLYNYVHRRIPTGGHLQAVLSNDLFRAIGSADETSLRFLSLTVRWLYNHAPVGCYGSPEKYHAWINGETVL